ncbi:ABC transporter substrate-binding protein [Streptococcus pneumoniae]|nr:ABC transporter substrate-binding protein [Streptococcus pneumoniae]
MKKMKVWSTVLATGVALTTLAACSGGSNSTTASSSEEKADKSQELVIYSNSVSNGRGDWLTAKAKEAGFNIKIPNFKLKLATQKKFTWRLVVQAFFRVVVNPIFDKSYFFRSRFLGSFR